MFNISIFNVNVLHHATVLLHNDLLYNYDYYDHDNYYCVLIIIHVLQY